MLGVIIDFLTGEIFRLLRNLIISGIESFKNIKIFNIMLKKGDIILVVPNIIMKEFYIPIVDSTSRLPKNVHLLPFAESTGISILFGSLNKIYPKKQIKIIPSYNFSEYRSHLLVMGGPSVNEVTHELLNIQHICKTIEIIYPDHYVKDSLRDKIYKSIEKDEGIIDDYGFLIISRNPFSPDYFVVIFMGVWAHGTNSAIQTFLRLYQKKIKNELKRKNLPDIQTVLKMLQKGEVQTLTAISHSKIIGLITGEPEIIDIRIE